MMNIFFFPESKILETSNIEEHIYRFFNYLTFVGLVVFLIFTIGIAIYFSMPLSNPLNDPFIQLLLHHQRFQIPSTSLIVKESIKQFNSQSSSVSSLPDYHLGTIFDSNMVTDGSRSVTSTSDECNSIKSRQNRRSYESLEFESPVTMLFATPESQTGNKYSRSSNSIFDTNADNIYDSTTRSISFSSNINLTRQSRRICIITAHPDDEVMFFSPTILQLCEWSNMSLPTPPYSHILSGRAMPIIDVYLLCFTNGDANGLGKQRSKELFASATTLGFYIDHIALIQEESLFSDDPEHVWDTQETMNRINSFVLKWNLDVIMTFDQYGISKHPNHVALYRAVKLYVDQTFHYRHVLCFSLQTTNIIMKYTGLLSLLLYPTASLIMTFYYYFKRSYSSTNGDFLTNYSYPMFTFVANPLDYIVKIWPAMRKHKSQLVWFRYLYMLSSMYLFQNSFILIEPNHFDGVIAANSIQN